jgi:hypothetical protein
MKYEISIEIYEVALVLTRAVARIALIPLIPCLISGLPGTREVTGGLLPNPLFRHLARVRLLQVQP